jgi:branched-chain amino acid transport system ATP-binding protein
MRLDIERGCAGYGAGQVLHDVSLSLTSGAIVTVVGANGAGKSTLLKCISGLVPFTSGIVRVDERSVRGLTPTRAVRLGIAHVPEGRQIFGGLSVANNLRLGAYGQRHQTNAELRRRQEEILALFPELRGRLSALGEALSGGQQQMLAIARGLMADPQILLLDEPSLGLAPIIVERIFAALAELRQRGLGILLVEQHAMLSLALADYGYVLERGRITLEGAGEMLLHDPGVAARYLAIESEDTDAAVPEDGALAERLRAVLEDA